MQSRLSIMKNGVKVNKQHRYRLSHLFSIGKLTICFNSFSFTSANLISQRIFDSLWKGGKEWFDNASVVSFVSCRVSILFVNSHLCYRTGPVSSLNEQILKGKENFYWYQKAASFSCYTLAQLKKKITTRNDLSIIITRSIISRVWKAIDLFCSIFWSSLELHFRA